MKITIVGTGYVGLVTGTCFAEMGNDVYCVDNDTEKIENLNKGIIPIYEPHLDVMVRDNHEHGRLRFTVDLETALDNSNICFIAVGTPMGEDGSADLTWVKAVATDIGSYMKRPLYVVNKSTVPVGTAQMVRDIINEQLRLREEDIPFDVISNPEFLREGTAVNDCLRPERVIVGADNDEAGKVLRELYMPFVRNTENFIYMDIKSAEMTKYAANAMLATKISFINEISNICEHVGADVNKVRRGIGSDSRIGNQFIYAGCGYGGSCFPKDVQALIKISTDNSYEPRILNAVEDVNQKQKLVIPNKITRHFGEDLSGLCFAVWGLSFKPDTDDMRESSAITIINEVTKRGASVKAYDPKAMQEAKQHYLKDNPSVQYAGNKYDVLNGADALILITEWKEFRTPDFDEIKSRLKSAVIFDGRNQYDKTTLKEQGFEYFQIGVKE